MPVPLLKSSAGTSGSIVMPGTAPAAYCFFNVVAVVIAQLLKYAYFLFLKLKSFVEIADICNGYITASATALYIVESTLSKQGYP